MAKQASFCLAIDNLQKWLKEAKERSNFSPVVKNPQARNYSQKPYHPYSRRNNYDYVRHRQGGSNYETAARSDFHRGKPIHGKKKGARQPVQRK